MVSRQEKHGERFVAVRYEVYAPRAMVGIAGLKDTLEDRSLPVFMARRRRDEPVVRLTVAAEAEARALRDACALTALTHIGHLATAYDEVPRILEREPLDDRAVDLWAPLLALTVVADVERDLGQASVRLADYVAAQAAA